MKKTLLIVAVCALGAFALSSCSTKTSSEKQPAGISKAQVDSVSYMLGYNLGRSINYSNMGALNINKIVAGIKAAGDGVEVSQEEFYSTVNGFIQKRMELVGEANLAKAEKFFEQNASKEGVQTTESGLQYQIVREGAVKASSEKDTVEVNYEGTTLDGVVFDSSYERGESVTFPLNRVIKGWTEGMQLVGEGGEITLWIPANLAYGERPQGDKIGPNEALKFKVEVIKVSPYVEPQAEETTKK